MALSEAAKRWRKENSEKYRESKRLSDKKYRASHLDELKKKAKQRYENDPSPTRDRARKRAQENPEENRRRVKEWRKNHPDKVRSNQRKQSKTRKYLDQKIIREARRRARKRAAIVEPIRANFVAFAVAAFSGCCAYCEIEFSASVPVELDHFVPLLRGGAHAEHNLVPCCGPCNRKKRSQDPFVFLHDRTRIVVK